MESNRSLRLWLAVTVVAIFAAACGGGGAGSTMPGTGGGTNPGSTMTSTERQQSAASSALAVTGNSMEVDQFGTASGATVFAIQRAAASRKGLASETVAPSCHNGVDFSQTSNGNGTFTETIEFFYDQQCTQPRKLLTLDVAFTSTGGTANGSEELWDASGNVVDYKTDASTFTFASGTQDIAQITVERSAAAMPSATPFAQTGFSCVFASGTPVDCGNATVATIGSKKWDPQVSPSPGASASPTASPAPYEIGFAGTVVGTFSTPAPSPSASPTTAPAWAWNPQPMQLNLQIAGMGYTGAVGAMTLATPEPLATPPVWTVAGGTQATTLTGTATLGFGPSGMFSSANITLSDAADGLTITFTQGTHGGLDGTMTNASGQAVATVKVDANGDGTIVYTSGMTAPIRDWVILST